MTETTAGLIMAAAVAAMFIAYVMWLLDQAERPPAHRHRAYRILTAVWAAIANAAAVPFYWTIDKGVRWLPRR